MHFELHWYYQKQLGYDDDQNCKNLPLTFWHYFWWKGPEDTGLALTCLNGGCTMKKFEYVETTIVQRGCAEKSDQKQIRQKYWGKFFLESKDLIFRRRLQFGPNRWHLGLLSFSNEIYSMSFENQIYMRYKVPVTLNVLNISSQYANFRGQLPLVLCRRWQKCSKYCNTCIRIYVILIGKEMNECYSTSILNVLSTEVG